jgi:poly-gamma-glutamate synthesis protein (capsule biosynthesis protein)
MKNFIVAVLIFFTLVFAGYLFTPLESVTTTYSKVKENIERKTEEKKTVRFLSVGDIMLSRGVAFYSLKNNNPEKPFEGLKDLLLATDFNFGNLESPFSKSDRYTSAETLVFNAPKSMVQGLVSNNFKVLNLANNHALDQGIDGLEFTRNFLTEKGIMHLGTGKNILEAFVPKYVEHNNIKVGFIGASYASLNDNGKIKNELIARIEDAENLKLSVAQAKLNSDFVVVTMHAGTEYTHEPNESQTTFARLAIDAGADIVIGAHPHWVQTIEEYKGKYIFYSLGNFIFDQDWSQKTKEGLVLDVEIEKNFDLKETRITKLGLLPIVIDGKTTPRLANNEEAERILSGIGVSDGVLVGE